MRKLIYYFILFCLLLGSGCYCNNRSSNPKPVKIGIAFGGGGAKGAAHIGVIKKLESFGIRPSYIAGTSIGAIVGGLYAAGYSSSDLESLFNEMNLGAVSSGDKVLDMFERLLESKKITRIENTKIPFRCVGYDLEHDREVVMSQGSLPLAMRASMSIPLVYEPVNWNGNYLVDGGLINNLPVDVVFDMGADVVIAIDLSTPDSLLEYIAIQILGSDNLVRWSKERPDKTMYRVNRDMASLYMHPNLDGYSAADFNHTKIREMLELGEAVSVRMKDEILNLKKQKKKNK